MSYICLTLIVRNEAPVIARCLNSVKDLVDYWVVNDNGSTDGTQDIIRTVYADKPGILDESPWVDFATNRNLVIDIAKAKVPEDAYMLVLDADDELKFLDDVQKIKDNLTAPVYDVEVEFAELRYYRPHFIKFNLNPKWIGVIHEAIAIDPSIKRQPLREVKYVVHRDGRRSTDPQKYQKDAALIEKAMETDPENSRLQFYLAQSYRDAQMFPQAREAYLKRAVMQGWVEENWHSLYMAARCTEFMGLNPIPGYLMAYDFRPNRVEPLVIAASWLRCHGQFHSALMVIKQASTIPYTQDYLFVEHELYGWRRQDELALAYFFTGKFNDAKVMWKAILSEGKCPDRERERLEKNIEWANKEGKP